MGGPFFLSPVLLQVFLRGIDSCPKTTNAPAHKILWNCIRWTHRNIGFAAGQIQEGIVDHDLYLNRRIQIAKLSEIRHQQPVYQGIGGRDANCARDFEVSSAQTFLRAIDLFAYTL